MTRPTRSPGPPDEYPDDYPGQQPTFTPHDGQQEPPFPQEPAKQQYPQESPYPQGPPPQQHSQEPPYPQGPPPQQYQQEPPPGTYPYPQQPARQGAPPPLPPNARQVSPAPPQRPPGTRAPQRQAARQPGEVPPPPPPTPKPTFTPRRDTGGGGGGGGGQPRPTFTPREGYVSPPEDPQNAYAAETTTFFAPPGYPQPSFQPFPQPEVAPREDEAPSATRVRDTGPQRSAGTQPNLMRSSKAMALGTIASRGTGFLRTLVLVAALGGAHLANAYNVSNTLPNTVYYLMLGGIFTSVVVPLLVKAAKDQPDKGEAYAERIFTLGAIALLVVTVIGLVLSAPIVDLYLPGAPASEHRVAVLFAYFFIPQIFFYGMDSLLGAILNTKGRFGPNMWTPVINNVVVIAVFGLYIVVVGTGKDTSNISSFGVNLLGIGTTLGIVIQSLALFPIVKRAGFSFRLRFDFRRAEVSEIGGMAGWMLGYVISVFAANLVLTVVADIASNHGPGDTGYSAFAYANQLFQLPYAIVGLSVISALLPRMAGHATDRRYSLVRDDFSTGVRLASVIVVPAAVFLGVLGAPLCELLFAYGSESVAAARYTGEVFGLLSLGLVPFMLTQLQLRVFYSFHDNRTPGLIGFVMLVVGVIGDFVALAVLPSSQVVLGLGAAYGVMTLAGAVLAWPLLLRRVGSLDGWRITRSLVRMFLATLPGLAWAFVTMTVVGSFFHQGPLYGFVSVVIGGGGALLLYAVFARILGIEEFKVLLRTVGGRFGR